MGCVIRSFQNRGTEDIFNGVSTRTARKTCPKTIWAVAQRKLDQINRVRNVRELVVPPGNRLERLYGEKKGQYSIRINNQYRICFYWENSYAHEGEITDCH